MRPGRPLHSTTTVGPTAGRFEDLRRRPSLRWGRRRRWPRGGVARSRRRADGSLTDHRLDPHRHRPRHGGQADGTGAQHRHTVGLDVTAPRRKARRMMARGSTRGCSSGRDRRRELEELVGAHRHELGEPPRALEADELELARSGRPARRRRTRSRPQPDERARHHGRALVPSRRVDPGAHGAPRRRRSRDRGRRPALGQLAGEMEVAAADAAARDPQQRLARARDRASARRPARAGDDPRRGRRLASGQPPMTTTGGSVMPCCSAQAAR